MVANSSTTWALPPLPSYTLTPRPSLIPGIPDSLLSLLLPIAAYWAFSMMFHVIDELDLFPQYRLHTPVEVLKRNKVSRWDVVRDVVLQQAIQTVVGLGLSLLEEPDYIGKEDYDVALWAQRIRLAQRNIPTILSVAGLDVKALVQRGFVSSPSLTATLMGGRYALTAIATDGTTVPAFAAWEMVTAKLIYWVLIPALQFGFAICIVDTWQYFLHRAMHMNKWLYTTFHSRHHRLYVPYAYGALYNHPFEGFLLDTLGTGLAYLVAGLSPRQAMCFFTGSTLKTVDDHCGYALPWDPLQHLTSNNAGYHDVHHQSWGIKTNFSQPFFTFWDRFLGTVWTGGDVSARYERSRIAAEKKLAQDNAASTNPRTESVTGSNPIDSIIENPAPYEKDIANAANVSSVAQSRIQPPIPAGKASAQALASREQVITDKAAGGASVIADEIAEEIEAKKYISRVPRKRSSTQTGSLISRVTSSTFHGRTGGVLGYESR